MSRQSNGFTVTVDLTDDMTWGDLRQLIKIANRQDIPDSETLWFAYDDDGNVTGIKIITLVN